MGKGWDHAVPGIDYWTEALRVAKPGAHLLAFGGPRTFHRMVCAIEDAGWEIRDCILWLYGSGFPKSHNLHGDWEGWGTALKPAHEPIIMARKPLIGTVAANVQAHGTGVLNIDACRVGDDVSRGERYGNKPPLGGGEIAFAGSREKPWSVPAGRWPANVIHDGSEEVLEAFPSTSSGTPMGMKAGGQGNAFGTFAGGIPVTGYGDSGSAARFFYCAKADRADRNDGCDGLPLKTSGMVSNTSGQHMTRRDGGAPAPAANNHPTVKPTDLMRYLCRLVTPQAGVVLDPFMGSGSTGRGAIAEGFSFIGIELDPAYLAIAQARITASQAEAEAERVAAEDYARQQRMFA
jgi:site-specific DNA-methyltransferase (adenine-specific)